MMSSKQHPSRPEYTLRTTLRDGDLGRLISIHGEVYAQEDGYGLPFEAYVARTVAEYMLENQNRGQVWQAEHEGQLVGCIAIAHRSNNRAQLRWLVVRPEHRGTGLGRRLVDAAMTYCRDEGFEAVFLETTDGLDASMRIYEKLGFEVVRRTIERMWDGEGPLVVMEKPLSG